MQARMGEALKGVPASTLIRGDAVAIQISVYEISFITGCVSSQMNALGFGRIQSRTYLTAPLTALLTTSSPSNRMMP